MTGNWQDPSGQVRRYTVVSAGGQADVDIPWNNAANGNRGYAVYGLPRPRGDMTLSGVSQVLDETPTPATNGTARVADVSVVTGDTFDVTVQTDAVLLDGGGLGMFRDRHADGGRALLRINEGHDANGNGVADYPSSSPANATQYGFEEFLGVNSPGYDNPATGEGLYVQTVDATQLAEGYHYVTSRVWREPRPGEAEVFTDFRETIYVDRLAPESTVESFAAFGPSSSTRDFQVRSLDQTADSVHVLLNLGAALSDAEVLALVDPSNQADQIDRDLFALVEGGVLDGNQVATVVTYEISGNVNVQRFTGLRTITDVGLGFGDLDGDNTLGLIDVDAFGGFLDDDSVFNPAADPTGDGLVRVDDLILILGLADATGADPSTVSAFAALFAAEATPGDYDLDGDVDAADYDAWSAQYGATGFASADGNFDGVVNAADYAVWRDAFEAFALGATVPEPTAALLGLVPAASGDVVHLQSGGRVVGRAVEADGAVVVQTDLGRVVVDASEVSRVERQSAASAEYRRRTPTVPNTAPAQMTHALWCRDQGLAEEAERHLRRVVEIEPDHSEARRLLGYQRVGAAWMTRDEILAARGLVRWRGEHRTPQEVQLLEEQAQREAARAEQRRRFRALRSAAEASDPQRRDEAFAELKRLAEPDAVPDLAAWYDDATDPVTRRRLVEALARAGVDAAYSKLGEVALRDPDPEARALALEALRPVNGPGLVAGFVRALRSNDNVVVNRAAEALATLGADSAVPALIDALQTKHRRRTGADSGGTTYSFNAGSGQYGFGGGGPKVIEGVATNPGVLAALVTLTAVNHQYDQAAWRAWLASREATVAIDLRRDP